MATITTSTFTSGDVNTAYQSPEDVRDWVERHTDAIKNLTPAGDTLVTEWPIKDPPYTASTTTHRISGESDALFLARHAAEYTGDMQTQNPDPS